MFDVFNLQSILYLSKKAIVEKNETLYSKKISINMLFFCYYDEKWRIICLNHSKTMKY